HASVNVRARIDGEIIGVHIKDGAMVHEGDPLFTLDPRGPEAQLRQAEAQLAKNQASLANVRREVNRFQQLAAKDYVARSKLDEQTTQAEVLSAAIRSDEAALANARLQLSFTKIAAPITGRAGAVSLARGNIVRANDSTATLVVIHQLDPIQVAFAVPQVNLPEIQHRHAEAPLLVRVSVPGDDTAPLEGKVVFIDNAVDQTTGTIGLKASFANGRGWLWPGQLVNVTLTVKVELKVVVVHEGAVLVGQNGPYVYTLKDDLSAEIRPIKLVRSQAGLAVVAAGLKPGETLVLDGHSRLAPGLKVAPRNAGDGKPTGMGMAAAMGGEHKP
ncbi:MAG: efflux RND transporter periplasmic adaptor subunit, partial [Rhodospirillales bacterium]|nr:efflux RND transporter periplasmic adaptor subunit [Rhodospirillales bacterium]